MRAFFSPKGHLSVSRPLAIVMNTMNLLAPTLLLAALTLAATAKLGDFSHEIRRFLMQYAVALAAIALAIRVAWGICIGAISAKN
ncbi:MAG: hypothetical protein HN341_11020 [Verrucomicrobia bacterium]|jgi:hypothetical protein|nr:hypothetical protein [Verrucomicrobiota bacterium]